jgi:hypothetical protein
MANLFGVDDSRDQDDIGLRISRQNVPASRRPVKSGHIIVHQHDIGAKTVVGLNRFKARAHDLNDFVIALGYEGRESRANAPLVIGYQHAHRHRCRMFHANASIIVFGAAAVSDGPATSLFEVRQEPRKQTYEWKIGTDLKDKGNAGAIGQRPQHGGADAAQTEGKTEE